MISYTLPRALINNHKNFHLDICVEWVPNGLKFISFKLIKKISATKLQQQKLNVYIETPSTKNNNNKNKQNKKNGQSSKSLIPA